MNLREIVGKEGTGTTVAVRILGWFAFEPFVLGGELVHSAPYHPLSLPLVFDVPVAGETNGITIDTDGPKRRGFISRRRDELLRLLPFFW